MSSLLASRTARWSLGAVTLCLVLMLGAWYLLISPRRDDAIALREQAIASDDQASMLQMKLTQLKDQAADLPQQKEELKKIAEELPPDADIPEYLRTLDTISTEAGVNLKSIAPGTPVLVTLAGSGTGDASAVADPAAATGLGSPGDLVSLPMNVELSGDYYELSSWLKALQGKVSRSYMVSAFALSSNAGAEGTGGLVGARIDRSALRADGDPGTAPTATPDGKGQEGSAATPTVSSTDGTGAGTGTDGTGTGTDGSGTGTVQDAWSLSLTGTVFVLLSDDSTLEDIKRDATAAQSSLSGTWTEVTTEPTDTPTAGGSVAATDPNTQTN
ncbi:type 4a pilus biogenesis protein PilO [Kineosporia babensis]|uniref:Type 4a pilus biogenesis protein PilO n=1 Tax=Kineosporia babensis TaxID=499548 RepID=A0A9X1SXU4_9ACTN|nr:type 4a pilus biogenesis protein PilO [Kineosporia babensis]MCD5316346.1 type 4a pilus biogenesis protein PilO [Kineosporia babensis]